MITTRSLRPNDYHAWQALWRGYLAFYETELAEHVYRTTFERLCSSDTITQNAIIAELGGEMVGLVHYIFHPHNWRVEDVVYLQDLFTAPQQRGKGVAKALINAVYHAGDKAGRPSVYWMTQEFNHQARHLYDQAGQLTPFIKYTR